MRNYELAYIAHPDLSEEALSDLETKIEGWIEAAGGQIVEVDRWGRRKLAYPIDDHTNGFYFFVSTQLPPTAPAELEGNMQVTEDVLRYLITRQEPA